jgi:glycosyltransferase 2 family protein
MKHAKTILKWLMYAAVLASIVFFVRAFMVHMEKLPPLAFNLTTVSIAVLSMVSVVVAHFFGTHVWRLLMSDQGHRVPTRLAVQVFFISQLGKYLPGNVGQFIGRGVLAKSTGIPVGVAVGTAVFEGIWNLVISASLALLATVLLWDLHASQTAAPAFASKLVWILPLALVAPWLGIKVVNSFLPRLSMKIGGGQMLRLPRLRTALLVSLLILVNFMQQGFIVKLQAEYLFASPDVDWFSIALLYSSAWVVGYVVPGSPGGLGVREAMMVLLLTPVTGAAVAAGLAVSMRLTTLLGDALTVLLGFVGRHLQARQTPPPASS